MDAATDQIVQASVERLRRVARRARTSGDLARAKKFDRAICAAPNEASAADEARDVSDKLANKEFEARVSI